MLIPFSSYWETDSKSDTTLGGYAITAHTFLISRENSAVLLFIDEVQTMTIIIRSAALGTACSCKLIIIFHCNMAGR